MATQAKPTQANGANRTRKTEWTETEKREDFKTDASVRCSRAVKAIRSVAGLARTARYTWTPEDVGKILGALAAELQKAERGFKNPTKSKRGELVFSL
jgi:hypothetical protein